MNSVDREKAYLAILKEELVQATGCTEPIAVAYCGAILKETLKKQPEEIRGEFSGNIIKNVKSVVVPNTGGMKGLPAAIAAGVIAGKADAKLQVISNVSDDDKKAIAAYMAECPISIDQMDTPCMLDIQLTGKAGSDTAVVRIANNHTNVVHVELNGKVLFDKPVVASAEDNLQDKSVLNVDEIIEFANTCPIEKLKEVLEAQIICNSAIAEAGLTEDWGAHIGATVLEAYGSDNIRVEAAAYAAAGSDARMSGCEKPVVIVSGSGNQGMTASLPVIRYAKKLGLTEEQLYRALAVSDLVSIHQKTGIGRLSAYCGAVSAGVGSGAAIAYMQGADLDVIESTIVNSVAMLSGTICDGAKPSCASKIFGAVNAGVLGYEMAKAEHNFSSGDGIVGDSVEDTIQNVGVLASQGMKETDKVILDIMTK